MSPRTDVFSMIAQLQRENASFAVATVVEIKGSSSGKPGSKAVFAADGRRLSGWVGGGCVENMAGRETIRALADGRPRMFTVDLEGDDLLLTVPCGGSLTIMVEPQVRSPVLLVRGTGRLVEVLCELAAQLDFRVIVQTPDDDAQRFPSAHQVITDDRLPNELQPEYLVLASHHPDDHLHVLEALRQAVPYIAVVASQKRSGLIRVFLDENGVSEEELQRLHTPAGLVIGAQTPEEIALSILAEIVAVRRGMPVPRPPE